MSLSPVHFPACGDATGGPFDAFSSHSAHPVFFEGVYWPTAEHCFQAQKFTSEPAVMARIRSQPTPADAAALGRDRSLPIRSDWDLVKEPTMQAIQLAKFSQHPELRAVLCGTEDAPLIERNARDPYWGDGGDGQGQNRKGAVMAAVRTTLRAEPEPPTKPVFFYHLGEAYGEFSNFSRHPVQIEGRTWPTTEHYFQAQKFAPDEALMERVRRTSRPSDAAAMGRDRSLPMRSDWEYVKEEVMDVALYAKFTQHQDLQVLLLGTDKAILVEHTERDGYWGDRGDGSGQNRLGVRLMALRTRLRLEQELRPGQPPAPGRRM